VKVLVSAAEASADLHASKLIEALRRRVPDLQLAGIGGSHLEAQGLLPVAKASDLAVMGSVEVLSKLPLIRRAGKALLAQAAQLRPDVAVLVDYPGFHFRIGPELKALGIPVVYFIPPKVWVWRRSRLISMKRWVSRVLCVLPFEPKIYGEAGIPAEYIGSPLVEELPVDLSRQEARAKLGLGAEERVLAVMPGSRSSEMQRHWSVFLDSAARFAGDLKQSWTVLIPVASTLDLSFWQLELERWLRGRGLGHLEQSSLRVRLIQEDSGLVLRAADLGLIKSGTSTLEAAVLECPMVIAYRPGWVTSFAVKHVLKYRGPVGLVNLFRGIQERSELIAPEILHEDVTSERLAQELVSLYTSPARLQTMKANLTALREQMLNGAGSGFTPSDRAAAAILEVVSKAQLSERGTK